MKSNYKKLGEYIELVTDRNTDNYYGECNVRGVSNNKKIIETRANNTDRDFSIFYIVAPSAFIYNSRTSRMGEKVGLGFNDTKDIIITSFNNTVFRVKTDSLLPTYLFMWFNRPEFDRYVRFHSWGSSTEIFSWNDMCNVDIPIPTLVKQHEIVKEYNTIVNRIKLIEQLCQKLEETAQAIYREWFVDFEFSNKIGKPYKSTGGEMVYCEELEKEIPKGWNSGQLSEIAIILMGQSPAGESYNTESIGEVLYQGRTDFGFRFPSARTYTTEAKRWAKKGDILMSVRAPVGDLNIASEDCIIGRGIASIKSRIKCNSFLYYLMLDIRSQFDTANDEGTIFGSITKDDLNEIKVLKPSDNIIKDFEKIAMVIDNNIEIYCKQLTSLIGVRDLLLSKLATIEN